MPAVLELDLPMVEGYDLDGEVTVVIPEHTREVLISLGWTPPR
ncbi:hypothetical protein QTQ03_25285 [Micromonospora sp. WMMA1363]|nr:hypothetical protein [Micromonospora sp. WMMA1363]MDM4722749.1 hypothetical protein [Micromonospora sp. WMMA1363]